MNIFIAAAALLVSLVPSQQFRSGYRSAKIYGPGGPSHHSHHHRNSDTQQQTPLSSEALTVLHDVKNIVLIF